MIQIVPRWAQVKTHFLLYFFWLETYIIFREERRESIDFSRKIEYNVYSQERLFSVPDLQAESALDEDPAGRSSHRNPGLLPRL